MTQINREKKHSPSVLCQLRGLNVAMSEPCFELGLHGLVDC